LTLPGRELEIAPGVDAPVFGTPNRAAILMQRLRGTLAPYRALFAKAQQVVRDTRDPYAAVVALERWFRASGGFVYSTQPPPTPGLPPLVGFTLETKTGYCQHFAGAMALMTRLLGIPARVAAGFVNGRYADGVWTITDHDAHTWVEVWFRGYGWLPFDPTPGRGYLAAAYSAASPHFDPVAEQKLLARVMRGGAVFGAGAHRVQSFIARNARPRGKAPHVRPGPATAGGSRAHSLVFLLALVVLGVIGAIAVAKLVRRRARYLTRDPRKVATACVRELSDFLVDQRLVVTRGLTIGDVGDELERRFAVSSEEFAAAVRAARFGPPARSRSAADNARKELAALKRRLRRRLLVGERIRGCVSLRSLGFS
jgi:hypothetical protein